MATQITAGKILRRGVESLGNDAMAYLLKNKEQVQRINDDFDSRRTALIEQHAATQAEIAKLEEKETGLAAVKASMDEISESIKADRDAADAEHNNAMGALTRRTREVTDKEAASDACSTALDAREQEIEDHGRVQEDELRGRLEAVEAQETAAEERDGVLQKQAVALNERHQRLETAAKMVKQAVASLG